MNSDIRAILEDVRDKRIPVEEAVLRLKEMPFDDIDFAKVDTHRKLRQGSAEVIYGAGKSAEQIRGIVASMRKNGQDSILITRLSDEAYRELSDIDNICYH